MSRIAVIGAGVCGMTAAIRLAQAGMEVELWESGSHPGGRTSSYFDQNVQSWVDRGPHLMVGAYQATRALLRDAGIESNTYFQPSLSLLLWDIERSGFRLEPRAWLPLGLALPLALARLPGHGMASVAGMLRLAAGLKRNVAAPVTAREWLASLGMPDRLVRDLLEVICLGAMNEDMDTASAASFARISGSAADGQTTLTRVARQPVVLSALPRNGSRSFPTARSGHSPSAAAKVSGN